MIRALLFVLAMLPAMAFGQCLPKSVFPGESGTDYIVVETEHVIGRVGWCPVTVPGSTEVCCWKQWVYQWQLKRLSTLPPTFKPFEVLDQLRSAASPASAVASLEKQFAIPLSDPVDIVRWKQWRYDACIALITPPYTLTPTPFEPGAFVANYCGTRPADPAPTWKTAGGTIFTYSGTRLTGIVTGAKITTGFPCRCDLLSVMSGANRYCHTSPGQAAQCILGAP